MTASLITLFTDASYCQHTRLASFAIWAKCDGQTIRRSGVFKERQPSSTMAELRALVNGLAYVVTKMKPASGSRIIAQVDCLVAIRSLTQEPKRLKKRRLIAAEREFVAQKITGAGISVEYRHVGGHKGTVTARNAVNCWCDQECRRHLREARAAISGLRTAVQEERMGA
jgi:ribonuclease HI